MTNLLPLLVSDYNSSELDRLRARLAQLESQQQVGNITYGGHIKVTNAPNVYTVGPFVRDFDSSFPAEFDLKVPENIIRLVRCRLRLKPRPIRLPATVAASSGQLTSDNGGGSTSGGGTSHSHTLPVTTNFAVVATGTVIESVTTGVPSDNQTAGPAGQTGEPNANDTQVNDAAGDPHRHGMALHTHLMENHTHGASHSHDISDSAITVAFGGGQSVVAEAVHTHTTPNHQHTIPGHTHSFTLGITEGGSPANVRLFIDNVDRSAALGGPWAVAAEVDITRYLIDSKLPPQPVIGVHPIKFTTTSVGAIEAFLDFYVIAHPDHTTSF